jgi:hypothetical protein
MRALVQANRANVDVTVANLKMFSGDARDAGPRRPNPRRKPDGREVHGVECRGARAEAPDRRRQPELRDGKLDSGQGTLGKLINEDSVHGNINEALESVKKGVESLTNTIGKINETKIERWASRASTTPARARARRPSRST